MHTYDLAHVPDETLLSDLVALAARDRQTTAALLAHLAEVEARELFLPAACSSMHGYCVRVLHLAEEVAFKRIRAARAARRHPQLFEAIADGRLHVSGVVLLAPHLTDANVDEVIAAAAHRSKTELEIIVARLAPKPDVPTAITPVVPAPEPAPTLQLDPDPVVAPPAPPPARVKALSPERFALQLTISQATRDKLDRATALLRHRNPSGDLAEVLDRALDALLVMLEREKFGATPRPRAKGARPESADPRHVSNDVKRTVHARDGEQCTFVSADGVRCPERGFLELDHATPVALGGKPTVDTMRVLCRSHNQYEADRLLGADFMRAKRNRAASDRANAADRANARTEAAAPAQVNATNAGRADTEMAAAHTTTAKPEMAVTRIEAAVSRPFDVDALQALCALGFKPAEARRAMVNTAHQPATTFEQRLRSALAVLSPVRPIRCSEAGDVFGPWTTAFVTPTRLAGFG
jgi:hypothetical protein